ncbi:MAG: translation initiation factor IF-2 [Mogibacterium sp.]|nr:translation initiation factor IF-2 [Mogibacterium sp.]
MPKKVSELTKELDITLQELKDYAVKMNIEIGGARSSIEDSDAERIVSTLNRMKGMADDSKDGDGKPKIKAVPVVPKAAPVAKAPIGKPVIPKKAVVPEEASLETEKKAEAAKDEKLSEEAAEEKKTAKKSAAKAEKNAEKKTDKTSEQKAEKNEPEAEIKEAEPGKTPEKEIESDKAAKKEKEKGKETAAETEAEKSPKKEKKSDSKSEGKEGAKASKEVVKDSARDADKEAPKKDKKPKEEAPEDYVNAPGKPMRFKKISDAETEKKKAEEQRRRQKEKLAESAEAAPRQSRKKKPAKSGEASRTGGSDKRAQGGSEKSGGGNARPSKGKSKKFFDNRDRDRMSRSDRREDGPGGRRNRNDNVYDERSLEKQERHKKKYKTKVVEEPEPEELLPEGTIAVAVPITVAGLSEQAEISVSKIIMSMMQMGVMATINQTLDRDMVEMLAADLGLQIVVTEEEPEIIEEGIDTREDSENDLQPRPPIITVMGHVDHGKTSLLDAIRNTNVTAGESGGITQHIGASEVEINGKKIVFLDTPGHEAFTTMRARGAQVTDIAVLVVAADDGVMPQTVESISHAKAAGVPIIVVINKMDKAGANPDRVKQELMDHGILVEEWGGDVISVPVSAKKGEGITDLLEMILLQADILELKANPDRLASGTVIEARLDKAKGAVATLLVSNGTLKTGQSVVAGTSAGKIRVMTDDKGKTIRKAGPATAVEILGLSEVPAAGDIFNAVRDDKTAREIAQNRKDKMREEVMARNASMTLDKLFSQIQEGEAKELNLIVKADVQGSVGAIIQSLEKLETAEVKINVIHSGVGTINESDIMLAETSNAIVIGFNVRPTTAVTNQAAAADVEIRLYRVIYDIIDEIQDAMKGMLDPEFKEEVLGKAEVRDTFKVPNLGIVAGCYITEGEVKRNAQIRLVRDGIVIHEGVISSLRRFKDDDREVSAGYECGLGIEKYNDIKPDDVIECFEMVEIERS